MDAFKSGNDVAGQKTWQRHFIEEAELLKEIFRNIKNNKDTP